MSKRILLSPGNRFGRLVVLRERGRIGTTVAYECECDCGMTKSFTGSALRTGHAVSCGCKKLEGNPKFKQLDLRGQRFGSLVALEPAGKRASFVLWTCNCDCGQTVDVKSAALTSGKCTSCGCYREQLVTKHGMCYTPTYQSWCSMTQRCRNPNSPSYARYGGRGIAICERWLTFENFLADMGERPVGTSIDRIDNDGNYEPGNCRWADRITQARNRVQYLRKAAA